MQTLDTAAMRLLSQKLDEWIAANASAMALGGSLVVGDADATLSNYSSAVGYVRALNDVRDRLVPEIEDILIRGK